jgi:Ca2+-binding RTX toxin-like protein
MIDRRTGRNIGCMLLLVGAGACTGGSDPKKTIHFDATGYTGLESMELPIVAGTCTVNATTGAMTLAVAHNEMLYVYKRATDLRVVANAVDGTGAECATTTTAKITITGDSGNNKVLIDYANGYFGTGTTAVPGTNTNIAIDLVGNTTGDMLTDVVTFRALGTVDTWNLGSLGLNVQNGGTGDKFPDVTFANVLDVKMSMGAGADVVTGMTSNTTAASTPTTIPMTVYGGDDADTLTSGATLTGSLYNTLQGDAGDDIFLQQANKAADHMIGGGGTGDIVKYDVRTAAITVTVGAGSSNDGDGSATAEADDVDNTVENVNGGAGNDTLDASAATGVAHTLDGKAGNDILKGSDGNDTLTGGTGDDILMGYMGNDTMTGGTGSDTIDYSDHAALVTVNLTANTEAGSGGEADIFNQGTADIENIRGSAYIDVLTGSAGPNIIWGGALGDTIDGAAGSDTIYGEGGADTIDGNDGDDIIAGGNGADVITGGNGNDLIDLNEDSGGPIADTSVSCGADNDILLKESVDPTNADCELAP